MIGFCGYMKNQHVSPFAIVCDNFRHGGGMERYVLDLARGFSAKGIRPVVFARKFDSSIPEYGLIDPVVVPVWWVPRKLAGPVFTWLLSRFVKKYGVRNLLACTRISLPSVAVCGGTHLGFMRAMHKKEYFYDRVLARLEKSYYQNSKVVVAHSKLMLHEVHDLYGIDNEKIRVIYPPTASDKFFPISDDEKKIIRAELGWPADKKVFLFPSTGHRRKGFDVLAKVFSESNLPVLLAVAGRPYEGVFENVRYMGYRKDIARLYQSADFTVLASNYEPFGLVGTESILCGTPVLLSANVACNEIISDSAKINFAANDEKSFFEALDRAVHSDVACQGKDDLLCSVDLDKHIDQLMEVLMEFSDE